MLWGQWTEAEAPTLTPAFLGWGMAGGLFQILATVCTVSLFRLRAFAVGITFKKTEVMLTALVGVVLLGDRLSAAGVAAIAVGFLGVILLSGPPGGGVPPSRSDPVAARTVEWLGPRFIGPYVGLFYGSVILSFMSGVLWGFATKAEGQVAATGYALSVLPALWAFFTTGDGPTSAAVALIAGFIGLLGLDYLFWQQGLAPPWWMKLRLILTAGVTACLWPITV